MIDIIIKILLLDLLHFVKLANEFTCINHEA